MKSSVALKITFLASLIGFATKAQPYTIPWAQQQPAWVFPLWFESGDGQKDTLYLVYEPGLEVNPQPADSIYGIKPKCVSNDSFWVSASYDSPCTDTTTIILKAIGYEMSVIISRGKYPFKMKWDDQLLYDTIFGQPANPGQPTVRLKGFWYHLYSPPYYGVNENDILADTAGFPCFYPDIVKIDYDSVVFNGPLPDITNTLSGSSDLVISLNLVPQSLPCMIGGMPERERAPLVTFYPNPFTTELFVENATNRPVELRLVNALGVTCETRQLQPRANARIDAAHLASGLYNLFLKTGKHFQTHKLIKLL